MQESIQVDGSTFRPGAMSAEEIVEFLSGPRSAWLLNLAVLKPDGWPAVVPLWYQRSGSHFYIVGRERSAWVQDLLRDARCGICVEEPTPPRIRKVLASCKAEVEEGPRVAEGSRWLAIANEMASRYLGPNGPALLAPSHNWKRYLVRLTPTGPLTTWQGPGWARRYLDR